MKEFLPVAAGVFVLAGCASTPPSRIAQYSPSPGIAHPQTAAAPKSSAEEHASLRVAAVKPIGKGELTAQNVENYMDAQEKELRSALRAKGTVISRVGDDLAIVVPAGSLFLGDSDKLSGKGQTVLSRIAFDVRKYDSTRISIKGFTDSKGTAAESKQSSELRAQAVKKALATDGVSSQRMVAKGFGAENARIPTGANVAEPRNRRVEIEISPIMKG